MSEIKIPQSEQSPSITRDINLSGIRGLIPPKISNINLPPGTDDALSLIFKNLIKFPDIGEIEFDNNQWPVSNDGTPIMYPITLEGGTYNKYENGEIVQVDVKDFQLPPATIAEFSRSKIRAKTHPIGNTGSVKEHFGLDDWSIRIVGVIIPLPNRADGTVMEQIERLVEFFELADVIKVRGDQFAVRKIYHIDIIEFDVPQIKGKPKMVPYSITCESDEPFELIFE